MTNRQAETETSQLHQHASAVDSRIAETYRAMNKAQALHAAQCDSTMRVAGFRAPQSRHEYRWTGFNSAREHVFVTLQDAIDKLTAMGDERNLSYGTTGNEALAKLDAARDAADQAAQVYYEAELDYEGWSRFFMVPGGHIHSSMNCSTCNHRGRRTAFGWLPELSGLTETEAVAEHGPVLCTVCYPSAPVEWTTGQLNDKGEYVAPKTYCPGSNTGDYSQMGRVHGWRGTRNAQCRHCGEWVQFGNNGLRKHQAPKGTEPEARQAPATEAPAPKSHCPGCDKPIFDDAAYCTPCGEKANAAFEAAHAPVAHRCERCGYDFTGKKVRPGQTVCQSKTACANRQAKREGAQA